MTINQLRKKYSGAIIKVAPKTYEYNKELLQEAYNKSDIKALAKVFNVSHPTMAIRLKEAGIEIKKAGWKGGRKRKLIIE